MALAAVRAAVRAALALGRFLRAWWARISSRCTSTSSSLSSSFLTCAWPRVNDLPLQLALHKHQLLEWGAWPVLGPPHCAGACHAVLGCRVRPAIAWLLASAVEAVAPLGHADERRYCLAVHCWSLSDLAAVR